MKLNILKLSHLARPRTYEDAPAATLTAEQSLRRSGKGTEGEVLAELRRFYRLTNARKLAHIERVS